MESWTVTSELPSPQARPHAKQIANENVAVSAFCCFANGSSRRQSIPSRRSLSKGCTRSAPKTTFIHIASPSIASPSVHSLQSWYPDSRDSTAAGTGGWFKAAVGPVGEHSSGLSSRCNTLGRFASPNLSSPDIPGFRDSSESCCSARTSSPTTQHSSAPSLGDAHAIVGLGRLGASRADRACLDRDAGPLASE